MNPSIPLQKSLYTLSTSFGILVLLAGVYVGANAVARRANARLGRGVADLWTMIATYFVMSVVIPGIF